MRLNKISPLTITITAVFTALVTVATIMFSIYVPVTRGYFNVGETMVYTSALLFGPYIGAFTGGVGSMLADLFLGYSIYAPATLIIKGAEGVIVGYLGLKSRNLKVTERWRYYTIALGVFVSLLILYIGITQYSGSVEASFGNPSTGYTIFQPFIPIYFWIAIAVLSGFLIILMGVAYEPRIGVLILSVLVGGSVMVLGYFIYQWFLFGAAAFAEIPINIGQLIVGLIISIPIVKTLQSRLLYFKGKSK